MTRLNWKLLTKKRGSSTQALPPGKEDLAWVTNTVTLIYGQRDAILVDTFLSVQHSRELVDWVVESGKNLTTIYITHAHGDHFFGLTQAVWRVRKARCVDLLEAAASRGGYSHLVCRENVSPSSRTRFGPARNE